MDEYTNEVDSALGPGSRNVSVINSTDDQYQREYIVSEFNNNIDNEDRLGIHYDTIVMRGLSDPVESAGGDNDTSYTPDLTPTKEYSHINTIKNDDLTESDLLTYLYSVVDYQGLVSHNIIAYDEFLDHGIAEIVQRLYNIERAFINPRDMTEKDKKIKTIKLGVEFYDVLVGMPTHGQFKGGETQPLFPMEARLTGIPYTAPITMNANVTLTAIYHTGQEDSATINIGKFSPCNIPIMTGSSHCHTKNLTRAGLKFHGEDPNEMGGIFILNGQEFIIDHIEGSRFNKLQCYFMDQNELVRGNFLSQPPNERFGNSSQIKVSLMSSGHITVEITSVKFSNIKIPFYLVYRLLGMTDATEIIKTVIYDLESTNPMDIKMRQILYTAFHVADKRFGHLQYEGDRLTLIDGMAKEMHKSMTGRHVDESDTKQKTYVNQDLLFNLDNVFLPHVGKSANCRIAKLRVLGSMIREVLLTHLGLIQPSDRDSLANKRMQGGGTCMPKLFKTMFNNFIITPFITAIRKEIKASPWEQIKSNIGKIKDMFDNIVHNPDLTRGLTQGITSSNKVINTKTRKDLANRVVSKILERKNFLFYIAALRGITRHSTSNASKQTKRADEIRRVHATMAGYICPLNSPDTGEPVGTKNNLAITATICGAGNSYNLKLKLLSDPEVIELSKVKSEDIARQKLAVIYVNGEWIGCTKNGYKLVDRYRKLRREHKSIERYTTIAWDTQADKIEFLLDADRVIRPLLIVDNNKEEYDAASRAGKPIQFIQNIRLTKDHIRRLKSGEITFEDIIDAGIVEYISPEEQENCYICPSFAELMVHKNNHLNQYTHMEIPPAIIGITGHMSPLCTNTQPARGTYQTNQSKQTSGHYVMNFDDRADKNRTFQYYNEFPLCKTLAARYIPPNGSNLLIGYLCNGFDQEDSMTFDKAAAERGMYASSYFKKESHELEQDEEFGNIDPSKVQGIKKNGNYNKLVDGVVPVGTIVNKGDILIGVMMKNSKRGQQNKQQEYEYVDRSIMYKSSETAVVSKVINTRGQNHERFITVVLRYIRHVEIGDKFCMTPDHDVLTTDGWIPITEITTKHKVATLNENEEIEYHNPNETYGFDHNGDMYEIKNTLVNQCITLNHKLYVSLRKTKDKKDIWLPYQLHEIQNIMGKRMKIKTNAINANKDIEFHEFGDSKIPMDDWLQFLGIWIADGFCHNNRVRIQIKKQRKINFIENALNNLKVNYSRNKDKSGLVEFRITEKSWFDEFNPLNLGPSQKHLPDYVWGLSEKQSKILLNSLIEGDGCREGGMEVYYTTSKQLSDDIQRLCLHCGYVGIHYVKSKIGYTNYIKGKRSVSNYDLHQITIVKNKLNPVINSSNKAKTKNPVETIIQYNGKVYCINVPNHIFYVRRNGKVSWTGNSTRSGNKAICAQLSPESDMPYLEDGRTLDIAMNPHSVPSRMTIGQLLESQIASICAKRGVSTDITAFRTIDKDNLIESSVKAGMRYNGKSRAYDGVTGRHYDIALFIVPVYLQKLQKYVVDNKYSVSRTCPTDATTGQPLSGKASGGGIRIGEMESITLETHGVMGITYEKFSMDSDGFQMHVCRRCGYPAVFNDKYEIYKCNMCGDKADISVVETSRSSVVFQEELAGANIKMKLGLQPREFEVLS
jgi:DNA-directed RNA polymerase beta subunit